MRYLVVILILALSIVMVIFGAQNTQTVTVKFLTYNTGEISLSLVIVLATLGGAVLSGLVSIWNAFQSNMRERALRRKLEMRNRELEQRVAVLTRDYTAVRGALQAQARSSAASAPPSGEQRPTSR